MNHLKLLLALICMVSLNACTDERLDEEFPTVVTTDLDGNEYFMRGTYGGKPFEVKHLNKFERNNAVDSYYNFIGTDFINENKDGTYDTYITLAISRDSDSLTVEEAITLGEFGMHQGPLVHPDNSFQWYLPTNIGWRRINGIIHSRAYDAQFDKIEIIEISPIDISNDPRLSHLAQTKKFYNVKGNFQVKLKTADDEIVELIIEEFSAMFL